VINVGRANITATLDMLATYAESLVRERAEQVALVDLQITTRVQQALMAQLDIGVAHIAVRTDGSSLILEGEALAREDRDRAEAIARSVTPRAVLDNRIVVHPPTTG
jgi:osmotically-inducible protein OsmY